LWEDDGKLVALAAYECPLGEGYLIVDVEYRHLKPEVIEYASKALRDDNGRLQILLLDGDLEFQRAAVSKGFRPTQHSTHTAGLDVKVLQPFALPVGFSFVSMADDWDWQQYNRVMWRGFNHEGRAKYDDETISGRKEMLSSPMINPKLVLAVKAPDGNYVSHCGSWYQPGDFYCYIEPVATDPEYRKMGLGKAVVLEAIKRCGDIGAKQAVVGSSQQFYYNIGFYPICTFTYWELPSNN